MRVPSLCGGASTRLASYRLMPDAPNQPPANPAPLATPDEAPAKPSRPGPEEPKNISASILPQRQADAAQHTDDADKADS